MDNYEDEDEEIIIEDKPFRCPNCCEPIGWYDICPCEYENDDYEEDNS